MEVQEGRRGGQKGGPPPLLGGGAWPAQGQRGGTGEGRQARNSLLEAPSPPPSAPGQRGGPGLRGHGALRRGDCGRDNGPWLCALGAARAGKAARALGASPPPSGRAVPGSRPSGGGAAVPRAQGASQAQRAAGGRGAPPGASRRRCRGKLRPGKACLRCQPHFQSLPAEEDEESLLEPWVLDRGAHGLGMRCFQLRTQFPPHRGKNTAMDVSHGSLSANSVRHQRRRRRDPQLGQER
ncbi:myosin heavy chain IB-like [Cavia porcellus]|uniref:myosin heavy chain IB-like n=1 Tax=Cavia porcellus TaxID=10141 RepID=UPI002FE0A49E